VPVATTATPSGTCTTSVTPFTRFASLASNETSCAPKLGGQAITAVEQARQLDVDRVDRAAVALRRRVDARARLVLADVDELRRRLQRRVAASLTRLAASAISP
jgi:hypothetical protein